MEIDQESRDAIAFALSELMGAKVVPKGQFDEVNKRNQKLLKQVNDVGKLQLKLLKTTCQLQNFVEYHSKWKPKTREIEKRMAILEKEALYIDKNTYSKDVHDNLNEAYNCYVNGQNMACYIMTLRTIEIAVSELYNSFNPLHFKNNGAKKIVPAINKLNWAHNEKMIGGADFLVAKGFIEARNEGVHEIYHPTDKELIMAFEVVIRIVQNLPRNVQEQ